MGRKPAPGGCEKFKTQKANLIVCYVLQKVYNANKNFWFPITQNTNKNHFHIYSFFICFLLPICKRPAGSDLWHSGRLLGSDELHLRGEQYPRRHRLQSLQGGKTLRLFKRNAWKQILSQVQIENEKYLQKGIFPDWEDVRNARGGRWMVRVCN